MRGGELASTMRSYFFFSFALKKGDDGRTTWGKDSQLTANMASCTGHRGVLLVPSVCMQTQDCSGLYSETSSHLPDNEAQMDREDRERAGLGHLQPSVVTT